MKPRKIQFIITAASGLLLAPAALAGNLWDGGGSAVAGLWNWSDNNNWDSNTPPVYGTLLTFGGSTGLTSNNNGATGSIAGITFNNTAGAFTLSGSSVTLGGNITNSSSSLQTINLPLVLDAQRQINIANGDITLGGAISGGFNLVVTGGTARTVTMNTAGSSYNRLQINSATTKLGVNNALPTSGGVTFASGINGGTLDLNGKTQTLGSTIVFGGSTNTGTASIIDSAGGGLLKLGGDVTQNVNTGTSNVNISAALDLNGATRTFTLNSTTSGLIGGTANGVITVSGAISNSSGTAGLTKAGVGTLTLSGANTFNGDTTVNAGLLTLSNALALQNSALDTTASIASSNATTGLKTTVTTLTLGGLSGDKNLATLFDSTNGYGGVTALTLNPASGQTPGYSGSIANGAAGMTLTKTGAGTQFLNVANSYTGGTAINGGILSIGNAAALGTTGTISFGGGTLQYNGITADLSSRFSTAANQAYRVDTFGQTVTWAGALGSSGGSLTKSGDGTLNLTGGLSNSFGGPIAVNGGILAVTDGTSLKNVTGAITVASGAAFNYSKNFGSGNDLTNDITLSGTGTGGIGALNLFGNVTATGAITLAADATISHNFNNATISNSITGTNRNLTLTTITDGQAGMVVSGAIQLGTGGITVTGAANSGNYSIQLGGDNTFTGGLLINNGVVQLNSVGALNSTAGSENTVTFGASTTTGKLAINGRSYTISNLTSNATPGSPVVENGNATAVTLTVGNSQNLSGTYAGVLQDGTGGGALSVSKAGTGALTLSGTNTYTGSTAVNAGSLIVNGSTSASSAVAVSNTNTRLMGTGTIGGNTTINNGAVHSAGTATGAVGNQTFSGDLTYADGSIFEWDINANSTASGFDRAVVSGDLTGGETSIFRVVFGTTAKAGINDTLNAFWNTPEVSRVWNMATLFGKNFTTGAFGSVETYDSLGAFDVSSKGSFGITGSTLTWTAVPEPTSALAGVLLAASMLRRRR
jgi:autotransporter-associated beta strand protein